MRYKPINLEEMLRSGRLDTALKRWHAMKNVEFSAVARAFYMSIKLNDPPTYITNKDVSGLGLSQSILSGFFQVGNYLLLACNDNAEAYGDYRATCSEQIQSALSFLKASSEANMPMKVRGDIVCPSIIDGKPHGRCVIHARFRDMDDFQGYRIWR
jgi:hypothetical protein